MVIVNKVYNRELVLLLCIYIFLNFEYCIVICLDVICMIDMKLFCRSKMSCRMLKEKFVLIFVVLRWMF